MTINLNQFIIIFVNSFSDEVHEKLPLDGNETVKGKIAGYDSLFFLLFLIYFVSPVI